MKDLHRALQVRVPDTVQLEYVPTNVFKAVLMDRTRVLMLYSTWGSMR